MKNIVVYECQDGTNLLKITQRGTYIINDKDEHVIDNLPFDGFVLIQVDPIKSVQTKTKSSKLSYYKHSSWGILSEEEYKFKVNELVKEAEYDEECSRYIFNTLQDRNKYQEFIDSWRPIFETVETYEPYNIIYEKYVKPKYPYITPAILRLHLANPVGVFRPNVVEIVTSVAKEFGFESVGPFIGYEKTVGKKISVEKDGQYTKINGKYMDFRWVGEVHTGPISFLEEKYEQVVNKLREIFKAELALIEPKKLDDLTTKDLLSDLEHLKFYTKSCNRLRDYSDQARLLSIKINELKNKYSKI